MTLALIAYTNETDLIYKEQDCLWFGHCVYRMYQEIDDGGIIFGHNWQRVPCENCMFLLKHEFIPQFVASYAASDPENAPQAICEWKFERWHRSNPNVWKKHALGVGRDRPINYNAISWYGQKFTPDEMAELKRRKLIEEPGNVFPLPET
jgi:hypothetical protein